VEWKARLAVALDQLMRGVEICVVDSVHVLSRIWLLHCMQDQSSAEYTGDADMQVVVKAVVIVVCG